MFEELIPLAMFAAVVLILQTIMMVYALFIIFG